MAGKTERMATEDRQKQIAQAALTLVGSQGLGAMTIERLARMVGLAPSALYRHYKNKAEVLDAVLNLLRDQFLEDIAKAREHSPDPIEMLHQVLLAQVRRIMVFRAIPRFLFSDEVDRRFKPQKSRIQEVLFEFIAQLALIVEDAQTKGLVRTDVEAGDLALMFLGVLQPGALMYHLSDGRFDIVGQADKTWDIFLSALQPKAK